MSKHSKAVEECPQRPASVAPCPVEKPGRRLERIIARMSLQETPEHRRRNDAQLATTKRQRPDLWRRLLALMSPDERADVERRAARAEQQEGGQQ